MNDRRGRPRVLVIGFDLESVAEGEYEPLERLLVRVLDDQHNFIDRSLWDSVSCACDR